MAAEKTFVVLNDYTSHNAAFLPSWGIQRFLFLFNMVSSQFLPHLGGKSPWTLITKATVFKHTVHRT